MSIEGSEEKLLREVESGDWTVTATTVAQILIGLVAVVGICAWATLIPVFILTFLFLEPLLIIGIVLFIIAAAFSEKTVLVERYSAGDVVFRQGNPADFVYVVRSGQLQGTATAGGSEAGQKFGPGDCFGTAAAVAHQPYRLTVTALTDAVVVRIDPSDLAAVAAGEPQFEKSLRGLLDARLSDLVGHGPERVA
jgi:CRP-like cAMP-binding protein